MPAYTDGFSGPNRRTRHTPKGTEYVLHATPVVTVSKCGRCFTLDSGGWKSALTKATINFVAGMLDAPLRLRTTRGKWVVEFRGEDHEFKDGMTLY